MASDCPLLWWVIATAPFAAGLVLGAAGSLILAGKVDAWLSRDSKKS